MRTPSLIKQPSENRLYRMDFSSMLEIDETLVSVASVTVFPTAGITLSGAATFSAASAFQRILGGTDGISYKVTFVVTTTAGNTLEGEGNLLVRDL